MQTTDTLPLLLAGPIIRHVSPQQLTLWLVCSEPAVVHLQCFHNETCLAHQTWSANHTHCIPLGKHAYVHLLSVQPQLPSSSFPVDEWLHYDIGLQTEQNISETIAWLQETAPQVLYQGFSRPSFMIKSRIDQLLHGSCRKPHAESDDAMWLIDDQLAAARMDTSTAQPALLLLSGDQIYADDVAAPLLYAIHQVIALLGLCGETLTGASVADSQALYASEHTFYGRTHLLPDTTANVTLRELFFSGTRKPIFTTVNADNHLITLAEMTAMYLLVWSPILWRYIDISHHQFVKSTTLSTALQQRYASEEKNIRHFASQLDKVQRALANVPVYMIFDDHDVTDDWNLTRGWEESAYRHPFSRRIIGNALIAYAIFQGWGNNTDVLPETIIESLQQLTNAKHSSMEQEKNHQSLITNLLAFEGWQYSIATQPKLIVLDTRTRRWRSERHMARPSGLMDWEALTDMQQQLLHEKSVILVSGAPIFGVKLIEVIQRVFTWFGHALTVDAENWMSHAGTAHVILNIFRHKQTPHHFVILSGDVHYSFVYDVRLRAHEDNPLIWQITSSGIKNTFPNTLLRVFDRLNRLLFASHSPLNWLTRRRHMRIRPRRPSSHTQRYHRQRLLNGSTIGRVIFDHSGSPIRIEALMTTGQCVTFKDGYESDWVQ